MSVSFLVDARGITTSGPVSKILFYAGDALKWAITSTAIFALFIAKNPGYADSILTNEAKHSRLYWATPLHAFCFITFLVFTIRVFNSSFETQTVHFILWVVLTLLTTLTLALVLTSARNLFRFLSEYKFSIAISVAGGFAVLVVSLSSRLLWEPLSNLTMHGSYAILGLVYDGLSIDVQEKLLGANEFVVHIAPECSGIDGMALALGITGTYLYFSRKDLSFPLAFLLLPIAAILALLFNVLRVAALIAIGASISEEIAIEGFHSVAGWISSVLIALLIIFVFSSLKQFQKESSEQPIENEVSSEEVNLATAILIPFVLFMGAALFAGIFKSDFDYLYPAKLIIPFITLLLFFRWYKLKLPAKVWEPIFIGLIVAVLWILFVPADPEANMEFSTHLFEMPIWGITLWMLSRMLGFWFFAPVVEELVFRCYLLNRMGGECLATEGRVAFSVIAFLVSSVLFGLLHADWLAGSIAGALFAVARYRSETVTSPIIAHASANVFIGIWAVTTQNWILL